MLLFKVQYQHNLQCFYTENLFFLHLLNYSFISVWNTLPVFIYVLNYIIFLLPGQFHFFFFLQGKLAINSVSFDLSDKVFLLYFSWLILQDL